MRSGTPEPAPSRHVAWIVGGGLLILSLVVAYLTQDSGAGDIPVRGLLWAAGILVLALGTPSVTAHRPLGTAALVGLGIWVVGSAIVGSILAREASGVGSDLSALVAWGYVDLAGRFLLALVAVVQIGRIEAVRRPWRWVPAWVLGAVALERVVDALLGAVAGQAAAPYAALGLGGLLQTGGTLVLGILAVALGAGILRERGGNPGAPADDPVE